MSLTIFAQPVLLALYKISVKHKKYYSYPSQLKILELLKKWRGIERCRRTLNYWLRDIEDQGMIKRKRRIGRHPVYGLMFRSTLYMITLKGYYLLRNAGVDVSQRISDIIQKLRDTGNKGGGAAAAGKRLKDIVNLANMATYREGISPPV